MARDYAARNRRPTPKPTGMPGWVWLSAGLSMGLVIAALVYIGRPTQPMPLATPPSTGTAAIAVTQKSRIEIPPQEEPRFDFYTLLEREQVVVPREDKPTAPKPVPPTATPGKVEVKPASAQGSRYLIVLGAFRQQANADGHRARLALAGQESSVERFTAGNGETLYRVRVGPEEGLARAQSVLAQLKSGGFDGRVVKID